MNNQHDQEGGGSLPDFFNLDKDLQFLHNDKRKFTRAEALPVVVWKIQWLKDKEIVRYFLLSVLKNQGVRFNFIEPERSEESIVEFFDDLKKLYVKASVLDSPSHEHIYWKTEMNEYLTAVHNSLFRMYNGRYYLPTGARADEEAAGYLSLVKKEEKPIVQEPVRTVQNEKLLKITDAAKILNCSRDMMYKVHLKQGLKTVKATDNGNQKIKLTDLNEYMENLSKKVS